MEGVLLIVKSMCVNDRIIQKYSKVSMQADYKHCHFIMVDISLCADVNILLNDL